MARVLLTGFEPFGGEPVNPSARVAEALSVEHSSAHDLHALVLPVERFGAVEQLTAAIDRILPNVIVMLGEAGGRACVTPERVAINVDDYEQPDNAGAQPRDEPVLRNGPVGYFSTLPLNAIVEALRGAGLPVAVSNSAGTYLCNRVFYSAMAHLDARLMVAAAGFVHLPYLHEQVVDKPATTPSAALDTLVSAVELIVEVAAEEGPTR